MEFNLHVHMGWEVGITLRRRKFLLQSFSQFPSLKGIYAVVYFRFVVCSLLAYSAYHML